MVVVADDAEQTEAFGEQFAALGVTVLVAPVAAAPLATAVTGAATP